MVSVRSLFTSALAVMAVPVMGALTQQQIVDGIKSLTTRSRALQPVANSITLINGPLIIIGQGPFPPIIVGFTQFVNDATTTLAQLQGTAPITDETDAGAIYDTFHEFAGVHGALLKTLEVKAGLFTTVPIVGQPVAAVLRQVESVVDTLAFQLIDIAQPRETDLRTDADKLSEAHDLAIKRYEGLSLQKRGSRVFVA